MCRFLESDEALALIERDPYWPKWDGPWWHMALLWEMNEAKNIPDVAVQAMVTALDRHYLKSFPIRPNDLPNGLDVYRHTACHCALATMYQVLNACDVDLETRLPWIRRWFLSYQLPDGGLNCDNDAYTRPFPKGSIVSTLPPLEAVLRATPRAFTIEEENFLDRGASYLINHRLFRRVSSHEMIKSEWLKLCFPRFYEYDLLRGLSFLTEWALKLQRTLKLETISETLNVTKGHLAAGEIRLGRLCFAESKTREQDKDGSWTWIGARTFPFLKKISSVRSPSPHLTAEWVRTETALNALKRTGLLA